MAAPVEVPTVFADVTDDEPVVGADVDAPAGGLVPRPATRQSAAATIGASTAAAAAEGSRTGARKSRPSRDHAERRRRETIRAAVAKHTEVAAMTDKQRAIAAAVLGCETTAEVLTVEILIRGRDTSRAADDLLAVAHATSEMEAGVAAGVLAEDRARLGGVWGLARTLDLVPEKMPTPAPVAALALARAVVAMPAATTAALDATLALIRGA